MKHVIPIILSCLIAYLTGAFILYEYNPGQWPEASRAVVVYAAVALLFLYSLVKSEGISDEDVHP